MPDAASLKREPLMSWDESATGWKKWWPRLERAAQGVNSRLVQLARIKAAYCVLDIATGNGEPAVTAARIVGPSGRVVAVDPSRACLRLVASVPGR